MPRTKSTNVCRWAAARGSLGSAILVVACACVAVPANGAEPRVEALLRTAVAELVKMQEEDGAWPYEGVYRVGGQIPMGYRVGGTAIVIESLLYAAPDDADARRAIDRGLAYILSKLDHDLLAPSTVDAYDVRVWGHCYVLQTFCRLREKKRQGDHAMEIEAWIPKLVAALVTEELEGGGWNYASRRAPASFVTAPVVQALLLAREQGEGVPPAIFERAAKSLQSQRSGDGSFAYSGRRPSPSSRPASPTTRPAIPPTSGASSPTATSTPSRPSATSSASRPATTASSAPRRVQMDALPGSIARSAVCESTLVLLGAGSPRDVAAALDAFHTHWEELEKRRKKSGTHEPPYGVAPYYFYYGHRYAAQAIQMLPAERRERERARLLETILRTRDEDGTWNDRVFPRSRNFGTAMIVLALLGDAAPLPPMLPGVSPP